VTHRRTIRRRRLTALLVVLAGLAVAADRDLPASSSSTPPPTRTAPASEPGLPGAAGLDDELAGALSEAAADAAADDVELVVNSGRRTREHQEQLLQDAIATYGSRAEAARWVATPETSPHVSGDAVDIGPETATAWLSEHGAEYGLCQIYANEPWHFELRPDGCPELYADPTHDPRMHK
jgi:LAS superfamily LD-carboxypeptidase LdcB